MLDIINKYLISYNIDIIKIMQLHDVNNLTDSIQKSLIQGIISTIEYEKMKQYKVDLKTFKKSDFQENLYNLKNDMKHKLDLEIHDDTPEIKVTHMLNCKSIISVDDVKNIQTECYTLDGINNKFNIKKSKHFFDYGSCRVTYKGVILRSDTTFKVVFKK